jgi:hypothetical protein
MTITITITNRITSTPEPRTLLSTCDDYDLRGDCG